jgi:hypothetical protein
VCQVLYIINPESVLYDLNVLCEPPRGVLCEPWDWFILVQTWAGSPQGIWTRAMSQRPPGVCTPALRIRCWPPRTGTTTKIDEGYVRSRRKKTIIIVWSSGRTKASSVVVNIFQIGLRVYRVQGFLSSCMNWVPPAPHP